MTISFTDEDCNEARYNFTARRDALVSAGAQIIKTDFPTPATFFPSNYTVCSSYNNNNGNDPFTVQLMMS